MFLSMGYFFLVTLKCQKFIHPEKQSWVKATDKSYHTSHCLDLWKKLLNFQAFEFKGLFSCSACVIQIVDL